MPGEAAGSEGPLHAPFGYQAACRANTRAERFWESMGYLQTRTRAGVQMGKRSNTLRVMVKPLAGGSIEEYLSLVPRDRPERAYVD